MFIGDLIERYSKKLGELKTAFAKSAPQTGFSSTNSTSMVPQTGSPVNSSSLQKQSMAFPTNPQQPVLQKPVTEPKQNLGQKLMTLPESHAQSMAEKAAMVGQGMIQGMADTPPAGYTGAFYPEASKVARDETSAMVMGSTGEMNSVASPLARSMAEEAASKVASKVKGKIPKIDVPTQKEMIEVIDYARLKPGFNQKLEENASILAEKFGIKGRSIADIANKFDDLIQKIRGKKGYSSALEPEKFAGLSDLSTKIVEKLKGKSTVSKQFITDLTNSGDVKQVERDLIRKILEDEGDKIDVSKFANKVKSELLPLKRIDAGTKYENQVTLHEDIRGQVANYSEHIYDSPIETSAGNVHFGQRAYTPEKGSFMEPKGKGYFGHTRVEDMADGKTRRVIEVQSDLYQKGGLGKETDQWSVLNGDESVNKIGQEELQRRLANRKKEASKLTQYNDPTAHFRMVREEIKKAAEDGKTDVLFPTGETAMKIEGMGYMPDLDKDNPIYKFYEKEMGKYLKSKYGAEQFVDENGVSWMKVRIKPEQAKAPVEAFVAPIVAGAGAAAAAKKKNDKKKSPLN